MVEDLIPPTVPLNPGETVTGPVTKGSPSSAKCVVTNDVGPDLSREGPFDACDAIQEPGQSPMVLDSMSGCQYRLTSYEDRTNRDDLDPSYGIHLHDPRLMEYMGAPESARLLGILPNVGRKVNYEIGESYPDAHCVEQPAEMLPMEELNAAITAPPYLSTDCQSVIANTVAPEKDRRNQSKSESLPTVPIHEHSCPDGMPQ